MVFAKKSLGQNFLYDKNIRDKIIAASGFVPSDTVLEIGSGRGQLTASIAEKAGLILAVEIDVSLCGELEKKFKAVKNVKILNKDILKLDIEKLAKKNKKIKVIGNIPYYISSPIIEHLLKFRDSIEVIFLTVQKELAKRIVCKGGSKEFGSFGCFVQYYSEPKLLFIIKRTSFNPAPKVDSAFLRLDVRDRPLLLRAEEEELFRITRTAFGKRRKMLKNTLKDTVPQAVLEAFFQSRGINPSTRPEDLSLQDFINLVQTKKN